VDVFDGALCLLDGSQRDHQRIDELLKVVIILLVLS